MGDKEHLGDLLKSFMPWVKELKGEIVISGYMLSCGSARFVLCQFLRRAGRRGLCVRNQGWYINPRFCHLFAAWQIYFPKAIRQILIRELVWTTYITCYFRCRWKTFVPFSKNTEKLGIRNIPPSF